MKISTKREVNESIILMNDCNYENNHKTYLNIDKIMAFGGDNFRQVCDDLDVKGTNALVVNGSGDQALELINRDFKYIDSFDINYLARHILNLKIAAITAFDYQEFLVFSKELFKNEKLYNKLLPYLKEETRQYFKKMFALKSKEEVYNKLVTHSYRVNCMNIIEYAKQNFSFYNEKDYYELKKKLLNCIINFKHMNLFEEQEIDKNYDLIYFSNILLFSGDSLEFFRDGLLSKYLDCLNKSGILVLNYAHHFAGIDKEKIRLNDLIANHLNEDIINCFASFIDITKKVKSSGFGKGIYEDDLVIALKKHD